MKNLLLSALCFITLNHSNLLAQDVNGWLQKVANRYNLSSDDVANYELSNTYFRAQTKMHHQYLQQLVNGYPVYNALIQLHFDEDNQLRFSNSTFFRDAANNTNTNAASVSLQTAFEQVSQQLNLNLSICANFKTTKPNRFEMHCDEHFMHPVRAKLVYFPLENGQLRLVYEFSLEPRFSNDSWTIFVDADNTEIVYQQNRTLSCVFHSHNEENILSNCVETPESHQVVNENRNLGQAVYNAFPLTVESPIHGSRNLLNAVEYPDASPYGWHDTNGAPGAEYTITQGNNVHAHEDTSDLDIPGYSPDGGVDLIFDFPYFETGDPILSLDASITNLFVWNNFLHDITYYYGFDEVSANFQQTNYTGIGEGNDFVYAHALDGSGNNNANFGTPEEGLNPRMQMYIWNHIEGALLEIVDPAIIADFYSTGSSTFGVEPPSITINADVVLVNDGSANPTLGCGTLTNGADLVGKIAYFDRGSCTFVQKVQNAQASGAVAVIIANNQQGGPMSMGGNDNGTLTIPVLSISQDDGALIKQQLLANQTVNANFGGEYELITHDSSFDNGIIAHEYGHGISNRLTGGGFQVSCLFNDEQMGEGWSDFFALIISDTINSQDVNPRGIGNFASNRAPNAFGIRPFPYTTDLTVNGLTYQDIENLSIPHGVGSVWCTMLWDLYWALVDEYGHTNELYASDGGNNKAIFLVMEGMRIQSCNPGFVDGRDAILAADEYLYDGDNQCLIWEVFARRGLGFSASQGSSDVVGDEQEAFDIPVFCTEQPGVGLGSFDDAGFVIYPNPSTDQVHIKSSYSEIIEQIQVYDLTGTLIASISPEEMQFSLDIQSWSNGLYLFEIKGAQNTSYFRLIKQ